MVGEILGPVFAVLSTIFYIWLIYKHGLIGTFEKINDIVSTTIDRLMYGPTDSQRPHVEGCRVLHIVAESEIRYSGQVTSVDLIEHLSKCNRHKDLLPKKEMNA